jgi:hypothetical protein
MAMLIVLVVLILPAALPAQSFWLERSHGKTLMLEIFKPDEHSGFYNGAFYPVDYSFETFALFLSLRQPIGSKYFLVAELAFAHAAFDTKIDRPFSFYRHSGASSTMGNPYIGLERGSPTSWFFIEAGIRLPLVKTDNNYAARIGEIADLDRREAFEDYLALKAMLNLQHKFANGLRFRLKSGAIIQYDFDYRGDIYFTFPGNANAQVGYETTRINLGASLINAFFRGRYFTWDEAVLGFTTSVKFDNLQLGVCIILPTSFGLNLSIQH